MQTQVSLLFSEAMTGFVSFKRGLDYETGFREGRAMGIRCGVSLVLKIVDVSAFLRDPQVKAEATGYVDCPHLGGRCVVERGTVNILIDLVHRRHRFKDFRYRLLFRSPNGEQYTLSGVKFVDDDGIIHLWRDTTKLFVTIFEGDVPRSDEDQAKAIGVGILRLHLLAFLKMMLLTRSEPPTAGAWLRGMALFLTYFAKSLWQVYGWGRSR